MERPFEILLQSLCGGTHISSDTTPSSSAPDCYSGFRQLDAESFSADSVSPPSENEECGGA
jgi:hypothetical protein